LAVAGSSRNDEISIAARSESPPRSTKKSSSIDTGSGSPSARATANVTWTSSGLRGSETARDAVRSETPSTGSADRFSLAPTVLGSSATSANRLGTM
jgi:hypothetical protein